MAVQEQLRSTQVIEIDQATRNLIAGAIYDETNFFAQSENGQTIINPNLLDTIHGLNQNQPNQAAVLARTYLPIVRNGLKVNPYDTATSPQQTAKDQASFARTIFIAGSLDPELNSEMAKAMESANPVQRKAIERHFKHIQTINLNTLFSNPDSSSELDTSSSQPKTPDFEGRRQAIKITAGTVAGAGLIAKFGPTGLRLLKELVQTPIPTDSGPLRVVETVKIERAGSEPELQIIPKKEVTIIKTPIPVLDSKLRTQAGKQIDIQISFNPQASEARSALELNPLQEVTNFDYAQTVDTLVQSIYDPENFYEQDGQTLNQELKDLIRQLATHPDPEIRMEAQDLALWYVDQIQTVVTNSGDLGQALRMADLAVHLEPKLQGVIEARVREAINIHQNLSKQKNPQGSPEHSPTQSESEFENKEKIVVDQRIYEDPENIKSDSDPAKTEKLPPSLAPFIVPSIGFSAQAFAAYINSQLSIAEGVASPDTRPQTWTVVSEKSWTEILDNSKLFDLLPLKAKAYLANSPRAITDNIHLITLEQDDCSQHTAPCFARAVVFGGLIKEGQGFRVTTVAEALGVGEAVAKPYQKTIEFFQK